MSVFSVYENESGSWVVVLPYKTTWWATKTAAEENAKAMAAKLGYVLVDGEYKEVN